MSRSAGCADARGGPRGSTGRAWPRPGRALAAAGLAFGASLVACSASEPADLAIESVRIVDATGARGVPATVLVRGGRITDIADPMSLGDVDAAVRIDGSGMTLIPGLWDTHVHLESTSADAGRLDSLLQWGVTTVRDLGGVADSLPMWRSEIDGGVRAGPTLLFAGNTLNGPPVFDDAPWHRFVTTPAEARAAVADQVALGADVIKVHRQLGPAEYDAILAEAATRGLRVVGHIPFGITPLGACDAGQAEITHVVAIAEAILNRTDPAPPSFVGTLDEMTGPATDALRACMVERGTHFAPNLSMYLSVIESASDVPARTMTENLLSALVDATRAMHEAGVPMLLGTDAGAGGIQVGSSAHDELELLVRAGLTPVEALAAATLNPARFHGLDGEVGLIAEGMRADLVLLAADPLSDIRGTRRIVHVIKDGRVVDRRAADR